MKVVELRTSRSSSRVSVMNEHGHERRRAPCRPLRAPGPADTVAHPSEEKASLKGRQVGIGKASASEPLLLRRNARTTSKPGLEGGLGLHGLPGRPICNEPCPCEVLKNAVSRVATSVQARVHGNGSGVIAEGGVGDVDEMIALYPNFHVIKTRGRTCAVIR